MKTLILVRHAKSDWSNLHQKDIDRPLNSRGLHDAPRMGKRLLKHSYLPDTILASTSIRTRQTAELIADELSIDRSQIQWIDSLYHASPEDITHSLLTLSPAINTVMLIAHNPGISEFANRQVGTFTDQFPTCAVGIFSYGTDDWTQIETAKVKLLHFDYPKKSE